MTKWLSIPVAADILGMQPAALRKAIDRRAVRVADGGVEAELDGVRARKLGRLWRIALSAAWLAPPRPDELRYSPSQNVRDGREGTRS